MPASEGPNERVQMNLRRPSSARFWLIIIAVMVLSGFVLILLLPAIFSDIWRKECIYNLRTIGLRCREYAVEHGNHFPNTWADLGPLETGSTWDRVFCCPSTHHRPGNWARLDLWADYHLLPGRSTTDPTNAVLAIESLANHASTGANVLFVDGRLQWWSARQVLANAEEIDQLARANQIGVGRIAELSTNSLPKTP